MTQVGEVAKIPRKGNENADGTVSVGQVAVGGNLLRVAGVAAVEGAFVGKAPPTEGRAWPRTPDGGWR